MFSSTRSDSQIYWGFVIGCLRHKSWHIVTIVTIVAWVSWLDFLKLIYSTIRVIQFNYCLITVITHFGIISRILSLEILCRIYATFHHLQDVDQQIHVYRKSGGKAITQGNWSRGNMDRSRVHEESESWDSGGNHHIDNFWIFLQLHYQDFVKAFVCLYTFYSVYFIPHYFYCSTGSNSYPGTVFHGGCMTASSGLIYSRHKAWRCFSV